VLFPERIAGKFAALHRPYGATPFTRPEIWLAYSHDLMRWGEHVPVLGGIGPWEDGRVGAGPPPIRVPQGWLEMYHGNRRPRKLGEVGVYAAGTLLLDAEDPSRVLHRGRSPIFEPATNFERGGFVPGVVFPTGIVEQDDTLLIYYGAADKYTALWETSRKEVLASIR
jgi:beta-1,2-mannobiose phosphorylase / 1,2-beta-oligomannan phosphorylase